MPSSSTSLAIARHRKAFDGVDRRRRRRTRRPPRGSGPEGAPRRRRTAACRTRPRGRAGRHPPIDRRPWASTVAASGRRWRGIAVTSRSRRAHITSGACTPSRSRPMASPMRAASTSQSRAWVSSGADALPHHVAVVVEAVEAVGELADPRRDLVWRAVLDRRRHRRRAARTACAGCRARGRGRAA